MFWKKKENEEKKENSLDLDKMARLNERTIELEDRVLRVEGRLMELESLLTQKNKFSGRKGLSQLGRIAKGNFRTTAGESISC